MTYLIFVAAETLRTTDSGVAIQKLKAQFARYGSPRQLVSDNGPRFIIAEFQKLT